MLAVTARATPLATYTKGSDGSAAHQFMNPCKVVVKADPGISSDRAFWLQPLTYTLAGTAVPALGWHAVRVEYQNASNQTVAIPLGDATAPVSFSVPKDLTGLASHSQPFLFKVLFATNRFRYGTEEPEYEEYISINADVLSASDFVTLDADRNGLRDAWETQYFGKVGNDPAADSDFDGVTNLQEQADGTNPNNPDSVAPRRIAYFPLDGAGFPSADGQSPRIASGVTSVPGFKGNAARIAGNGNILNYDWQRPDGSPNYSFTRGSVRLWIKPDWSSDTMSGTWSRLFEIGGPWGTGKAYSMLRLHVSQPTMALAEADGSGHFLDYESVTPFSWSADSWHQIVYTYTPTGRSIYVDGALVGQTTSSWAVTRKAADIIAAGLTLGNESPGNQPIKGAIDEVECFNYELTPTQIAADYDSALRTFTMHVTLDEDTTASITLPVADAPNTTCTVATGPSHGALSGTAPYLEYKPYAHYNGSDSFTIGVTRGGSTTATATVSITITPVNDAPLVDAGASRTLILSGTPATASTALHATVTDIDSAVFTYQWSLADGPAEVTFTTPSSPSTSTQFTTPGLYKLRVKVSDGIATRSDMVLVLVNSAASALSVTLQNPGSAFSSPAAIPLVAAVSAGTPARVDFYEGSRQIGSDSSAPYAMTWLKSGYGAYRVTAVAVDAAGHTAVSAPLIVSVQGALGIAGSGAGSSNGPGNDGDSNSGGDGGAGAGGSGTASATGSDGGNGGGTGVDPNPDPDIPPDPNSDDDGDGVLNGEDLYPYDYRRSEDVSPIHYAVIDLGKDVISEDKEVDQIAMGQDGRVAFSWNGGSAYKVAKWSNGQLEAGSPKSMATKICFAHYPGSYPSGSPDSYSTPYDIFPNGGGSWVLNANGDVAGSAIAINNPADIPPGSSGTGSIDYSSANFAIWPYGAETANERLSAYIAADTAVGSSYSGYIDSAAFFLDNGTVVGSNGWDVGLASVSISGDRKALFWETDFGISSSTIVSSVSGGGIGISWISLNYDYSEPRQGGVEVLDLQGHHISIRRKDGADSDKVGTIQVINDTQEFILADSDLGKFISYTGTTSHGKLEQLLPEKYSRQTRYGSDAAGSSAKMEAIANNGTLLFTMENLEGKGSGAWVKDRQFLAPKIPDGTPGAVPFGHDLHVLEFPDNYKVQLLGGPQGITDDGLLAAKIKRTKNDDGTAIPADQQKWRPGLLLPLTLNTCDRILQGSIDIPTGWTQIGLAFKNKTTGQDLGKFANLEPGATSAVKIYDTPDDFFSEAEMAQAAGGSLPDNIQNQKVVFARDPDNPRRLRFCTVFDEVGDVEVTLTLGTDQKPYVFTCKLTHDETVANFLDEINQRIQSMDVPGSEDVPVDVDGDGIPDGGGSAANSTVRSDILQAFNAGTISKPSALVPDALQDDPNNLVLVTKGNGIGAADNLNPTPGVATPTENDSISTMLLKRPESINGGGTLKFTVSNGAVVRIFDSLGKEIPEGVSVDLASPDGGLAALATEGRERLYVQGLKQAPDVTLTLSYSDSRGRLVKADAVHLRVVSPQELADLNRELVIRPIDGSYAIRSYADNGAVLWDPLSFAPVGEPMHLSLPMLPLTAFDLRDTRLLKLTAAWPLGFVAGFWGGIKGDAQFLYQVAVISSFMVSGPGAYYLHAAEIRQMFQEIYLTVDALKVLSSEVSNLTPLKLDQMRVHLYDGCYTEAEKAIPWEPMSHSANDSPDVQTYMHGYLCGFAAEFVVVGIVSSGAGDAAKMASTLKNVLESAKDASVSLAALSAADRAAMKVGADLARLASGSDYKQQMAALGVIAKYLRSVELEGGTAAEYFDKAFLDKPELKTRCLQHWFDAWGNLPTEKKIPRIKLAARCVAELKQIMGTTLSDEALEGFALLQKKLFKESVDNSDRFPDLKTLWKGLDTPEKKQSLNDSLAAYKAAVQGGDPNAKFWIKNITGIQSTAYRYSSFAPSNGWSSFSGSFPSRPEGWYASFDFYDNKYIVTDRLLLPLETSAPKYRFEFDTSSVQQNSRIVRGEQDTADIFEPICRDEPVSYPGGGTSLASGGSQFKVDGSFPVKKVVDLDTGQQVWP